MVGVRTLFPFLKVERSLILVDREIIMGACNGVAGHVGPESTCCAFHVFGASPPLTSPTFFLPLPLWTLLMVTR